MKALSARTVSEILSVFEEFEIEMPDTDDGKQPTKKELLHKLAELGIDNKTLREWEGKKTNDAREEELLERGESSEDVVVCMNRRNQVFSWRGYKFTQDRKFLPMPKQLALELIQEFGGFKIATREEIVRYYK